MERTQLRQKTQQLPTLTLALTYFLSTSMPCET